ncbi:unnamed protein product, partial [Polarella glacialis]
VNRHRQDVAFKGFAITDPLTDEVAFAPQSRKQQCPKSLEDVFQPQPSLPLPRNHQKTFQIHNTWHRPMVSEALGRVGPASSTSPSGFG